MNQSEKASALSDSEIVERIAVEVMGFNCAAGWNPIRNWNHFRFIEEKLMEDGKSILMKEYLRHFDGKGDYMGSTLREKCLYLISALDNE